MYLLTSYFRIIYFLFSLDDFLLRESRWKSRFSFKLIKRFVWCFLNVSGFLEFSCPSVNTEKGKVKKKKKNRYRSFCRDKGENHNNIQLDKFFRKAISYFWGDRVEKEMEKTTTICARKLSSTVTFVLHARIKISRELYLKTFALPYYRDSVYIS